MIQSSEFFVTQEIVKISMESISSPHLTVDGLQGTAANKMNVSRIISGSFMVAGTAIGAGMLGIPLVTSSAGFWPACLITVITWLFMISTGLIFLEVAMSMPPGANLLSMSKQLLGNRWEKASGVMFIFLYYCLIVAYIAAGSPFFENIIYTFFDIKLPFYVSFTCFTLIVAAIVTLGSKAIDRVNIVLYVALILAFLMLIHLGLGAVKPNNLRGNNYSLMWFSVPMLFGAFGFHNVIPSITTYLKHDKSSLKCSLLLGSFMVLVTYLIWQYLILGSVDNSALQQALSQGQTATYTLQEISGNSKIFLIGQYFSIFAIVTSLLGVSFSVVDFYADGFSIIKWKAPRWFLAILTFVPPLIFSMLNRDIFAKALGLAGGFGEAFLNGIIPVMLVWSLRYTHKSSTDRYLGGGKFLLGLLFVSGIATMILEGYVLFTAA